MKNFLAGVLRFVGRLIFIRLPAAVVLAVVAAGGWFALEYTYNSEFPFWPLTPTAQLEVRNPNFPENPSRVPWTSDLASTARSLSIPLERVKVALSFGSRGYGAALGILFAVVVALPLGFLIACGRCGLSLITLLVRIPLLAISYAALFGAIGYALAGAFEARLIPTGYALVFGAALPFLLTLPMTLLIGIFPSRNRRMAARLVERAQRLARGPLLQIAGRDADLRKHIQKNRKDWRFYVAVAGSYIAGLMAERQSVPERRRTKVMNHVEKLLRRMRKDGDEAVGKLAGYVQKQLDGGSRFSTDFLVGLWLLVKTRGQSPDGGTEQHLAKQLGSQIVASYGESWDTGGGGVGKAVFLWLAVGVLTATFVFREQLAATMDRYEILPPVAQALAYERGEQPDDNTDAESEPDAEEQPGDGAQKPADNPSEPEKTDSPAASKKPGKGPLIPNRTGGEDGGAEQAKSEPGTKASIAEEPATKKATQPPAETDAGTPAKKQPAPEPPKTAAKVPANATDSSQAVEADKEQSETSEPTARAWTDQYGRQTMATYLGYRDGKIGLRRADGRQGYLPLETFSRTDLKYVMEQSSVPADESADSEKPLVVRTWSDRSGSRSFQAALIDVRDGKARFLRPDGRLGSLPVEMLTEEDQRYLQP